MLADIIELKLLVLYAIKNFFFRNNFPVTRRQKFYEKLLHTDIKTIEDIKSLVNK